MSNLTSEEMRKSLDFFCNNSNDKTNEIVANKMLTICNTLNEEGLRVVPDKVYKIMALKLIKKDKEQYKYVRDSLKNDKDILEAARKDDLLTKMIRENTSLFKHFNQSIRSDKSLVLEALAVDGLLLEFVDEKLRSDPEVIKVAVKQNKDAEKFVIKDTFSEIEEFLKFKGLSLADEDKGDKHLVKVYRNDEELTVSIIKTPKDLGLKMGVNIIE